MRIISFAWTAAAFISGNKTVTRRQWTDRYAASLKEGELLQAWDKSPRFGGKRVGTIRLTRAPYKQAWRDMPDSAYFDEGFDWLARAFFNSPGEWNLIRQKVPLTYMDFIYWRDRDGECWVVEFEITEVFADA